MAKRTLIVTLEHDDQNVLNERARIVSERIRSGMFGCDAPNDPNSWKFSLIKAPALSPEQYAQEGGTRCPNCESHDIFGGSVDIEGQFAYQDISCANCNARWTDVYTLTLYRNLDIPRAQEARKHGK